MTDDTPAEETLEATRRCLQGGVPRRDDRLRDHDGGDGRGGDSSSPAFFVSLSLGSVIAFIIILLYVPGGAVGVLFVGEII